MKLCCCQVKGDKDLLLPICTAHYSASLPNAYRQRNPNWSRVYRQSHHFSGPLDAGAMFMVMDLNEGVVD